MIGFQLFSDADTDAQALVAGVLATPWFLSNACL